MSKVTSIMSQIRAENLLEGSDILTQIAELRASVQIASEGDKLNFDDYFLYLQEEGSKIPRLELLKTVPARQEGNYQVQLIEALDRVQEAVAFVYNKAIAFQTRLIEVDAAIKTAAATFEAWYLLALDEALNETELKLPQTARKGLANSEFNRLMGGAPIAVLTLQVAVKAEIVHLDTKKKMAREKCDRGRDQINASFMSQLPGNTGISAAPGSLGILQDAPQDEEEEPVPTFISKRQRVAPEPVAETTTPVNSIITIDMDALAAQGILVPTRVAEGQQPHFEELGITADGSHRVYVAPVQKTDILADIDSEPEPVSASVAEVAEEEEADIEPAKVAAKIVEQADVTPSAAEDEAEKTSAKASANEAQVVTWDVGIGDDITVASVLTYDGTGKITNIVEIDPAEAGEGIKAELAEIAQQAPTGFFKTGVPAEARIITPAEVITHFTHDDAESDAELRESIAEAVETEEIEEAVISAEVAENTTPILRTEVTSASKLAPTFQEFEDDELDDLLSSKPRPQPTVPTPEPIVETKPTPTVTTQPVTRKKLAFTYDAED